MEGYKSLREAVESVSSVAKSWQDVSSGEWFTIDDLRKMGTVYDEAAEPDGWNYFVTFEESGEICLASTCTREIEFLYVPAGSKYKELLAVQAKKEEEMQEAMLPVLEQMVLDKIDELGEDPEKFAEVFQQDSKIAAGDFINRAARFEKPGSKYLVESAVKDDEAKNVLRMLKSPGFIERTEAARNKLRNSPEDPIETESRTVRERMEYCVKN